MIMGCGEVRIRLAAAADLPAINTIYNYYVALSTCTYQIDPEPMAGRQAWFAQHGPEHPILVAEADGEVVGWGALSPFHPRMAFRHTVEDSIYVRHDRQRLGIGSALMLDLLRRGQKCGHHAIVALIDADQSGSIMLHARHGFEQVGHLQEVGRKFDRWLDVIYMELILR
jgi:phosphinothricin acetyltransferase